MEKTPLQELIEQMKDLKESLSPNNWAAVNSCIRMTVIMLEYEKEFAGKVFEAGSNRCKHEWTTGRDAFNWALDNKLNPDFETYYKQFQ